MTEIKSWYGPPFDNLDWAQRKEEIKTYLEYFSESDAKTHLMLKDLWVALEAEEKDKDTAYDKGFEEGRDEGYDAGYEVGRDTYDI